MSLAEMAELARQFYRLPNPLPRRLRGSGAGKANLTLRNLGGGDAGTAARVPRVFDRTHPTSSRRRWSQLLNVPMVRDRAKHPRPWEGPLVDFASLPAAIATALDAHPDRLRETVEREGNHAIHELTGKLAELNARITKNMFLVSWPRISIAGTPVDASGHTFYNAGPHGEMADGPAWDDEP